MEDPRTHVQSVAGLKLDRPRLMGIVNVTPDSFSDGGQFQAAGAAIAHGLRLAEEGADILDIGGESTRPGAETVSVQEELDRVIPVIEGLAGRTDVPLSIDTRKPEVMQAAIRAGAAMINDVSALTFWDGSLETAASLQVPVILMHAQGTPQTMQAAPHYDDVVGEVMAFLKARLEACIAAGMAKSGLVIDPGIGFGKTLDHNLTLLAHLGRFHELGVPILVGASRKSFIHALAGVPAAEARLPGSLAAGLAAVAAGVQLLRVHDVAATRQALTVWQAIYETSRGCERQL